MKYFYTIIALLFSLGLVGQQEQQFTQFMHNKLALNPGYAGSDNGPCFSALVRSQWIGLDGAPQTQMAMFNMPMLNLRTGIGVNLSRHTIGVTSRYTGGVSYAYRPKIGHGYLGIGIQASVRSLQNNYTSLVATQGVGLDNAIPTGTQTKFLPNFGFGIYYTGKNYYFGVSAPRLLENNINMADGNSVISREVLHLYTMGGFTFVLSDEVTMTPQILMKYVSGAPFDADLNVNFQIMEKFLAGLSYRFGGSKESGIGESTSLLAGWQATDKLFFGAAYDASFSELRDYNSGSVEVFVQYCIKGKPKGEGDEVNPRKPKSSDFYD